MNRINDNNYAQWIERFLAADTTLEEERELYAYFSRPDLPAEARRYREMFGWYESMQTTDVQASAPARTTAIRLLPLRRRQWGCVAAVVALLFAAGYILRTPPAMYNYVAEDGTICRGYMIRDGKRITDRTLVTAEIERINSEFEHHIESIDRYLDEYDTQLRDDIMSSYDLDNPEIRSAVEASIVL